MDTGDVWFKKYGWKSNPFKVNPDPKRLVGFSDLKSDLITYMMSHDCCLLLGSTGAGKTTLLRWLKNNAELNAKIYYFTFNREIDRKEIENRIKRGFLSRLFSRKGTILLLDEAQDMPESVGKWLKAEYDEGNIQAMVISAISRDILSNLDGSLLDRVGDREVRTRKLKRSEAEELIDKRVLSVGEENPFTDEALIRIFRTANFFPRKILELAERVCIEHVRNRKEGGEIPASSVRKALGEEEVHLPSMRITPPRTEKSEDKDFPDDLEKIMHDLTPTQRSIIRILSQENLSTQELAERMDRNRSTVSKELSRLALRSDEESMRKKGIESPVVERKGSGRPVIYGLASQYKRLFVRE